MRIETHLLDGDAIIFMGGLKALVDTYQTEALRTTKPQGEKCEVTNYPVLWEDKLTEDGTFLDIKKRLANDI